MLTLDAINFGSGWFPTLRKRPGSSGYYTVAWALADRFRADGPWTNAELRALDAAAVADVLGQDPDHELMGLYAQALRDLGDFLGDRTALDLVEGTAGRPSERLAESLARRDAVLRRPRLLQARPDRAERPRARGGRRRSTTSTGSRSSPTTSSRTCCGWTACCATSRRWRSGSTARSCCRPARRSRRSGPARCTPCELIAERLGVPPRVLDTWLWNRGQEPRYKARPRHRTRTVFYPRL